MVNSDQITSYMPLHGLPRMQYEYGERLSADDLLLVSVLSAQATDTEDAVTVSKCISYGDLLRQLSVDLGLTL